MKTKVAALVLILAMVLSSMVYAFDGTYSKGRGDRGSRHELLSQLPEEKEMLFHQTMREAREKTADIREQMRALRTEIKDVLTASAFDEALFLEKSQRVHELHSEKRAVLDAAIVTLAKQFTPGERKILAELFPMKQGRHGRSRAR